MGFAPFAGQRDANVTDHRTNVAVAHYVPELVDERYPHAENICLVRDHLTTHHTASLYDAFAPPEAKRIADT